MTKATDWEAQTGRSWAEMYRQTDRSFAGLTQRLLECIAPLPGEAVLDVGCGAGELSLALARARPRAQVVGIDVSPDLLSAARSRGSRHGNVRFIEADAGRWHGDDFEPDLLVSRHGVMFFDDPIAAFAHLRVLAAAGASFVFSCFRPLRENPWMAELAQFLPSLGGRADPEAPGPFAFGDPHRVREVLARSGWREVDIITVDYAFVAGQGDDPVGDASAFFARIGPAATALGGLPETERQAAWQGIREWLTANRRDDIVAFPAAAWIVAARNG